MNKDQEKETVARAAVELVRDEQIVELGTGSTTAYAVRPDAAIAIDVYNATDIPDGDPNDSGEHPIGKPAFGRGAPLSPRIFELLCETGEAGEQYLARRRSVEQAQLTAPLSPEQMGDQILASRMTHARVRELDPGGAHGYSSAEGCLTIWSSAASEASPLQRRVRPTQAGPND